MRVLRKHFSPMFEEPTFEKIGGAVVLTSGIVTATFALWKHWKRVWLWLKPKLTIPSRLAKMEVAVENLTTTTEHIKSLLEQIFDEVKTNGAGQTLRVALKREIENRWRYYEINGKAVWETARMHDHSFGCVRYTDALLKLVGQSPQGTGWINALHPEDKEFIVEAWESSIRLRMPYDQVQRFLHKDTRGRVVHTVYVRAFFRPEFNEDGDFIGGMGQCTELTEEEYTRLKSYLTGQAPRE